MECWPLFLKLIGEDVGSYKEHELKAYLWVDEDNIPVLSGFLKLKKEDKEIRTMFRFINNLWVEFADGEKRINGDRVLHSPFSVIYGNLMEETIANNVSIIKDVILKDHNSGHPAFKAIIQLESFLLVNTEDYYSRRIKELQNRIGMSDEEVINLNNRLKNNKDNQNGEQVDVEDLQEKDVQQEAPEDLPVLPEDKKPSFEELNKKFDGQLKDLGELHEKTREHVDQLLKDLPTDEQLSEMQIESIKQADRMNRGLDRIENNNKIIEENIDKLQQQWREHHKKFPGEAPLHQDGDWDLVEQEFKDDNSLLRKSLEEPIMICLEKENGACPGEDCSGGIPHLKSYKCRNCCDKSHCVPLDNSGGAPGALQESEPEKGGVVDVDVEDVQQPAPEGPDE